MTAAPGRRVPGHPDAHELAVRAVLGQQVSVKAATKLAARLVADRGAPLPQPVGAITHVFPRAEAIAELDPASLPMPRGRGRTLVGIATELAQGRLMLDESADRAASTAALLALPGIGPWTAGYIAMRALRDPDAFTPGDAGVRHGLVALRGTTPAPVRWSGCRSPGGPTAPTPSSTCGRSPHDDRLHAPAQPCGRRARRRRRARAAGGVDRRAAVGPGARGGLAADCARTFDEARRQLTEYFAGGRTTFHLPLRLSGTAFQNEVWGALTRIPFGETRSYGALAEAVGRPRAARAVGAANGQTPFCIVVPCHRLIGAGGGLVDYAAGQDVKRRLLTHEARVLRRRTGGRGTTGPERSREPEVPESSGE